MKKLHKFNSRLISIIFFSILLTTPLTSYAINFNCKSTESKEDSSVKLQIGENGTGEFLLYKNGLPEQKCDAKSVLCSNKLDDIQTFKIYKRDDVHSFFQTEKNEFFDWIKTLKLNRKTGLLIITNWESVTTETKRNEEYTFKKETSRKEWKSKWSNHYQCE